jgi:hypothetical protein
MDLLCADLAQPATYTPEIDMADVEAAVDRFQVMIMAA